MSLEKGCYCEELISRPCPYCETSAAEKLTWANLSSEERAKATAYKRLIATGKTPSALMLRYINNLTLRHTDFHVGIVP